MPFDPTPAPSTSTDAPISRRTILAGAAWTLPAVYAAAATPAMAASPAAVQLSFGQTSYTGGACGSITGISVTATRGGLPAAGLSVTVSLGRKYTFTTGSATYSGVSGTDGRVALPAVTVPPEGGTASVVAVQSAVTASATIVAPAAPGTSLFAQAYSTKTTTSVPSSSDAVALLSIPGSNFVAFVSSDGTIRDGAGAVLVSGADPTEGLTALWKKGPNRAVTYKKNGQLYTFNLDTGATWAMPNASGTIRVFAAPEVYYFNTLDSSGNIRDEAGDIVASGVDTQDGLVAQWTDGTFTDWTGDVYAQVTYKKGGSLYHYSTQKKVATQVPNSALAIRVIGVPWQQAFVSVDSDGTIRDKTGNALVSGVETAPGLVAMRTKDGQVIVTYKKSGSLYNFNTVTKVTTAIPDSGKAIRVLSRPGSVYFASLDSDGTIRNGAGVVQATGVDTSAGLVSMWTDGSEQMTSFKKIGPC